MGRSIPELYNMHSSVGGFVCAVLTSRIIGSASSKLSSRYRRLLRSERVTKDGIAPNSLSLAPFSIFLFQFLGLQCLCFFSVREALVTTVPCAGDVVKVGFLLGTFRGVNGKLEKAGVGGHFRSSSPSVRVRGLNRCAASTFGVFGISSGGVKSDISEIWSTNGYYSKR